MSNTDPHKAVILICSCFELLICAFYVITNLTGDHPVCKNYGSAVFQPNPTNSGSPSLITLETSWFSAAASFLPCQHCRLNAASLSCHMVTLPGLSLPDLSLLQPMCKMQQQPSSQLHSSWQPDNNQSSLTVFQGFHLPMLQKSTPVDLARPTLD